MSLSLSAVFRHRVMNKATNHLYMLKPNMNSSQLWPCTQRSVQKSSGKTPHWNGILDEQKAHTLPGSCLSPLCVCVCTVCVHVFESEGECVWWSGVTWSPYPPTAPISPHWRLHRLALTVVSLMREEVRGHPVS